MLHYQKMTITRRSSARAGRASSRSAGVRRGRVFFQPTNAFLLRQARNNRIAGEALIPRPEGFAENINMPPLSPVRLPVPLYLTFREIFGAYPAPVPFPGFVAAQRRLPFGAPTTPATLDARLDVFVPATPPRAEEEEEDLELTAWRGQADAWRVQSNAWSNAWRGRAIPATPEVVPATPEVVPATPQVPHSPASMGYPFPHSPVSMGLPATPESPLYSPMPPQLEPATPPRGNGKKKPATPPRGHGKKKLATPPRGNDEKKLDEDDDDDGMSDDEVDRYQQAIYESTIAAASPPRCPYKSTDGCKEMPIKLE